MKKLISLILALVMVMGLAVGVSAEENADNKVTLTVQPVGKENDPLPDGYINRITYTAYKLMDADLVDGDTVTYSIPVDSDLKETLEDSGLFTLVISADGATYQVIPTDEFKDAANANALIEKLKNITLTGGIPLTWAADENTNKDMKTGSYSASVDPGYYLIKSSLGSNMIVDTTMGDTTVFQKNSYPTVTKTSDGETKVSYGRGETVPFEITVTLPSTPVTEGVVVHDVTDDLEGFTVVSVKNGETALGDGEYTTSVNTDNLAGICSATCAFHLRINAAYVNDHLGETVVISYTAVTKTTTVNVSYNKAFVSVGGYKSVESTVRISNNLINVYKVDGNNQPLAGASFVLAKDVTVGEGEAAVTTRYYYALENDAIKWVTDIDDALKVEATGGANPGDKKCAVFYHIPAGEYVVIEAVVPEGYNQAPEQTVDHTDPDTNGDIAADEITVVNNTGSELPSTGGIGTTLFYVIGGLLMTGAAVLLITKKRMA